jgi:hypothetical protein
VQAAGTKLTEFGDESDGRRYGKSEQLIWSVYSVRRFLNASIAIIDIFMPTVVKC